MTPPRTGGVAVARIGDKYLTKPQVADLLRLGGGFSAPAENGRWLPLAETERLLRIEAAARDVADEQYALGAAGIVAGPVLSVSARKLIDALRGAK